MEKENAYTEHVVKPNETLTSIIMETNGFLDQSTLERQVNGAVALTSKLTRNEELKDRIYEKGNHNWPGSVIQAKTKFTSGDTLYIPLDPVDKKQSSSLEKNLEQLEENVYTLYSSNNKKSALRIANSNGLNMYKTIDKMREKEIVVDADIRILKNFDNKLDTLYDLPNIYLNSENLSQAKEKIKERLHLNIKSDTTIRKYLDYYSSLIGTERIRKSELNKA